MVCHSSEPCQVKRHYRTIWLVTRAAATMRMRLPIDVDPIPRFNVDLDSNLTEGMSTEALRTANQRHTSLITAYDDRNRSASTNLNQGMRHDSIEVPSPSRYAKASAVVNFVNDFAAALTVFLIVSVGTTAVGRGKHATAYSGRNAPRPYRYYRHPCTRARTRTGPSREPTSPARGDDPRATGQRP